jgi:hypothetical protein
MGILNGSDDGEHTITGFLDFFHRPVFLEVETWRFVNWICFRTQNNGPVIEISSF